MPRGVMEEGLRRDGEKGGGGGSGVWERKGGT